jgi:hypothetical protein
MKDKTNRLADTLIIVAFVTGVLALGTMYIISLTEIYKAIPVQ